MFPVRSLLGGIFKPSLIRPFGVPEPAAVASIQPLGNQTNLLQIRTKVRYHLPYPTEVKRVRKQGYKTLIATYKGRKQLMTRLRLGRLILGQ